MSYQSVKCFYKLCDKCDSKGCGCSCHTIHEHSAVIQFIIKKRVKSKLKKRKDKLIPGLQGDNDNDNDTKNLID